MSVAPLRMAAGLAAVLLTFFVGPAFAQGYQTTLQISPQGGGRCIEVPNREFIGGQRLQMMDCNNSPAQIFTYDQANMRLTIGGLCIDANGGQPGDLVKLWSCDGGAAQVWKAEQKGNFTKLVGTSGLCLDIRYGSTEKGAPLQSWTCGDAEPNQLWSLQRR
jgi:Ricin-type beta-trefoil lectin domain